MASIESTKCALFIHFPNLLIDALHHAHLGHKIAVWTDQVQDEAEMAIHKQCNKQWKSNGKASMHNKLKVKQYKCMNRSNLIQIEKMLNQIEWET